MSDILTQILPSPRDAGLLLLDETKLPYDSLRFTAAIAQLRELQCSIPFNGEANYRITALVLFLDQQREKAEEREELQRYRRRARRWLRYGGL